MGGVGVGVGVGVRGADLIQWRAGREEGRRVPAEKVWEALFPWEKVMKYDSLKDTDEGG